MTAVTEVPQLGLLDQVINDAELASCLAERQTAKEELQPYRERYLQLDKQAKASIQLLELEDGAYRCGRFIVTLGTADTRLVSFELASRRRVNIKLAKEE